MKRAPEKAERARKSELPQFLAPMLATLVAEPPAAGDWVYEVKYDGYRMLARLSGAEVRLFTRSGKDWTGRLPHLAAAVAKLGLDETWLDGEIVVLEPDGRASFQRLQNAFDAGRDRDIVYFVFDAPFLSQQDLRRLPLAERKKRLRKRLKDSGAVRFSADLKGSAAEVLEQACKLGLVAPIEPELEWDELKAFTQRIAQTLAGARPDLFTAKIAKARRADRIFVDYLRNSETASAVAAFSPRARPNAGVSVPLAWDELDPAEDVRARFTLLNIRERLAAPRSDPWVAYWKTRQSLTAKMKKSLGF